MFRTKKSSARVHEGRVPSETKVYEGSLTDHFHAVAEERCEELPKITVGKLLRRILAEEEKAKAPETAAPFPN
jgi:hypothetical protein